MRLADTSDFCIGCHRPGSRPLVPRRHSRLLFSLYQLACAEIASHRRVSLGTVRNQTKSLLSKTKTDRQSDLVRLLMTLPHPPAAA